MLKKMSVIAAGTCILLALSGCGQAKQNPNAAGSGQAKTPAAQAEQPVKPPAETKTKLKAYFGDENGEKLVEKEVEVVYKQEEDKYMAALKALTSSADARLVPLFKGFTFKTVVHSGPALTVDLSMSPDARTGAPGEELILEALRRSLFQFPEIQSVDVTVDGKKAESLMGHLELPHPMKRS